MKQLQGSGLIELVLQMPAQVHILEAHVDHSRPDHAGYPVKMNRLQVWLCHEKAKPPLYKPIRIGENPAHTLHLLGSVYLFDQVIRIPRRYPNKELARIGEFSTWFQYRRAS